MAALVNDDILREEKTLTTARDSLTQRQNNTVTAFRGVWQAKVGTMQQCSTTDIKSTYATANSNPSLLTAETGNSEVDITNTAAVSSPAVFQLDLSMEEVSDRKSATAQIKLTASSLWQTLSPWKRHNKVAPSPAASTKHCNTPTTSTKSFKDKENISPRHMISLQDGKTFIDDTYPIQEEEKTHKNESSPKYSKVNKQRRTPPLPPSLPSSCQTSDNTSSRYIETTPSTTIGDSTTSQVIQVLSQSLLSGGDQDSLYESLKDENEEPYSEIIETGNHSNKSGVTFHSDKSGVQLLSIKGHMVDHTEEGLLINEGVESGLLINEEAESGSLINEGAVSEMYPIHYAAARGDKKELKRVLSLLPIIQDPVERVLGSDRFSIREGIDVRDRAGRTPLMYAVHHNHLKCVKMLVHYGASISIETPDGSTCLHEAAHSGSMEMIALLLSLGANGMKKDNEGRLPIHWCMNNSDPECARLLLEKVPGLSPDVTDNSHMTPLMWAGYYGRSENVELLKHKGADATLVDCEGMTAVHWSAKSHDTRTLQLLLNTHSAEYKDEKGRTIMHYAAKEGFAKAVSIIKGTSPLCINEQDNNGRTSLHWAAACEKPDLIRALLSSGADPNLTDVQGYTALDYAVQKHLPYCSLLLAQGQQEQQQTLQ